jgi:acyl-CoA thioester hydrolase
MTTPTNAFELRLTVEPGDIDEQQHVSNVTVVKWMSRAAWEHSKALGYDMAAYHELGAWFVVRRHEIDYHHPARLGDELVIATWPSDLRKAVAERRHVITRASDHALIAEGLNVWAYVDATTSRPLRMPPQVREAFDPDRYKMA